MMSLIMFIITTVRFLIECTIATFYEDSDVGLSFMPYATGYSGIATDHMLYHTCVPYYPFDNP